MDALADGRYDVLIVDVEELSDRELSIELTIVGGESKGAVVALRSREFAARGIDLLGLPATLVVDAGVPHLTLD